ncbi:UvrD-helicase domain-containing protein, partial [Flavobacterium celericrescens]|uniref:UvrD-helicase domain-containing protein n=1 Tax=Flavobacterium celericrescens TaxID=2709780 RepID=UPI001F211DD5
MNQQQQNIINITQGKHIVLAPPGTGKTEILTQRLLKALENGVDEDNIVNLTFTNRAAREMNNRVK